MNRSSVALSPIHCWPTGFIKSQGFPSSSSHITVAEMLQVDRDGMFDGTSTAEGEAVTVGLEVEEDGTGETGDTEGVGNGSTPSIVGASVRIDEGSAVTVA